MTTTLRQVRRRAVRGCAALLLLAALVPLDAALVPTQAVAEDVITNVVSRYGDDQTMVLNAAGNPVIVYYDRGTGALTVVTCFNARCSRHASEKITGGFPVSDPSLALNAAGHPVVSFYDWESQELKVAVCGDKTCATKRTTAIDASYGENRESSIQLTAEGHPVVAYREAETDRLLVVLCSDPRCESRTTVAPNTGPGGAGRYPTLILGSGENPVILHYDGSAGDLKLTVCADPLCQWVTNTVFEEPGSQWQSSMVLDPSGDPVIAFPASTAQGKTMRVAVCGDRACGNRTVTDVNPLYDGGGSPSVALTETGSPVVAYVGEWGIGAAGGAWLAACSDAQCSAFERREVDLLEGSNVYGDPATTLALSETGHPIFSYYHYDVGLIVTACDDPLCDANRPAPALATVTIDEEDSVGRYSSLLLNSQGNPVISYYENGGGLKLARCNDWLCADDPQVERLAQGTGRNLGLYSAMALRDNGEIWFVVHVDTDNGVVELIGCGFSCRHPFVRLTVDSDGDVGAHLSMVLPANGATSFAYYDATNKALKLAICSNRLCYRPDHPTYVTVDDGGDHRGQFTSAALDDDEFVVVSHYNATLGSLSITRCADQQCQVNSTFEVDGANPGEADVGRDTSLQINSAGDLVVSYYDSTNGDLKLAVCGAGPPCATTVIDAVGDVGRFSSLDLAPNDNPMISYYDSTNGDLKLAVCGDPGCSAVDLIVLDEAGNVGSYSSLVVDDLGLPVVSYYDATNTALKLARCSEPLCYTPPSCDGQPVTIDMNTNGGNGNGTPGDDVILGTPGSDRIRGFGGNDTICGGDGVDHIVGGSGDDAISGEGGSDRLYGQTGHDTINGGSGADKVWAGPGNDTVFGGGGQDRLRGGSGDDVIQGNHASDDIWGEDGQDTLRGAKGKDEIWGGAGNDLMFGGDNTDSLIGGADYDEADGQRGRDTCSAEVPVSC